MAEARFRCLVWLFLLPVLLLLCVVAAANDCAVAVFRIFRFNFSATVIEILQLNGRVLREFKTLKRSHDTTKTSF